MGVSRETVAAQFAVVAHVFMVLYDGEDIPLQSAPGAFLALLLVAGLASYVHKKLVYPSRQKHPFAVAAVNRLKRATEVVLQPKDRMFSFEPG